jgi:hypothetical protein
MIYIAAMRAQLAKASEDWDRYGTAHVVFQPRYISPEELENGHAWCYGELFSHRSIWKRRPEDPQAIQPICR